MTWSESSIRTALRAAVCRATPEARRADLGPLLAGAGATAVAWAALAYVSAGRDAAFSPVGLAAEILIMIGSLVAAAPLIRPGARLPSLAIGSLLSAGTATVGAFVLAMLPEGPASGAYASSPDLACVVCTLLVTVLLGGFVAWCIGVQAAILRTFEGSGVTWQRSRAVAQLAVMIAIQLLLLDAPASFERPSEETASAAEASARPR